MRVHPIAWLDIAFRVTDQLPVAQHRLPGENGVPRQFMTARDVLVDGELLLPFYQGCACPDSLPGDGNIVGGMEEEGYFGKRM